MSFTTNSASVIQQFDSFNKIIINAADMRCRPERQLEVKLTSLFNSLPWFPNSYNSLHLVYWLEVIRVFFWLAIDDVE